MSSVPIDIPESLKHRIESLAAAEGSSLEQFVAAAAGEKLSVVLTMGNLKREAAAGHRDAFDRSLAAVPDAEPPASDRIS